MEMKNALGVHTNESETLWKYFFLVRACVRAKNRFFEITMISSEIHIFMISRSYTFTWGGKLALGHACGACGILVTIVF